MTASELQERLINFAASIIEQTNTMPYQMVDADKSMLVNPISNVGIK